MIDFTRSLLFPVNGIYMQTGTALISFGTYSLATGSMVQSSFGRSSEVLVSEEGTKFPSNYDPHELRASMEVRRRRALTELLRSSRQLPVVKGHESGRWRVKQGSSIPLPWVYNRVIICLNTPLTYRILRAVRPMNAPSPMVSISFAMNNLPQSTITRQRSNACYHPPVRVASFAPMFSIVFWPVEILNWASNGECSTYSLSYIVRSYYKYKIRVKTIGLVSRIN